jgi:hypothetical protein
VPRAARLTAPHGDGTDRRRAVGPLPFAFAGRRGPHVDPAPGASPNVEESGLEAEAAVEETMALGENAFKEVGFSGAHGGDGQQDDRGRPPTQVSLQTPSVHHHDPPLTQEIIDGDHVHSIS